MSFYDENNFVQAEMTPEDEERYDKEIREIIVITNDSSSAAVGKRAQTQILAAIDVKTNELNTLEGCLVWRTTEKEFQSRAFFKRFKKGTAYRVLVRKQIAEGAIRNNNQYYVIKVLAEGETDDRLENILREYRREVVIEDEALGKFVLNKDLEMFEGSMLRQGEKISLYLEVEKDKPETWNDAYDNLKRFVSELEARDAEMRRYSAQWLTDLANDWLMDAAEEDEEPEEITQQSFAERIGLCEISVDAEGGYTVFYSDDDMFWGHSIQVCGSFDEGIESAEMVG